METSEDDKKVLEIIREKGIVTEDEVGSIYNDDSSKRILKNLANEGIVATRIGDFFAGVGNCYVVYDENQCTYEYARECLINSAAKQKEN